MWYTCAGTCTCQVIDDWPQVVIPYYVIKQIICLDGRGQTLWMHPEYTRIHLYAYYCNKRLFLWSLWYTYSWNGVAYMRIAYHWWKVYVHTFQSWDYQQLYTRLKKRQLSRRHNAMKMMMNYRALKYQLEKISDVKNTGEYLHNFATWNKNKTWLFYVVRSMRYSSGSATAPGPSRNIWWVKGGSKFLIPSLEPTWWHSYH